MSQCRVIVGDCIEQLRLLPAESVHCVISSPPYFGLRAYGIPGAVWGGDPLCAHKFDTNVRTRNGANRRANAESQGKQSYAHTANQTDSFGGDSCACGAWRGVLGSEPTPALFAAHMVEVFIEVRRVLRRDGTLWVNLGDSFATGTNSDRKPTTTEGPDVPASWSNRCQSMRRSPQGVEAGNMLGIPWMIAFALQADGWILRRDVIWCLSGGTWVYARTKKGDMPIMLRDVARLNPATVKLWNGEKWTQVLGWSRTSRNADELEFVLRSGERISCTPTHQFPTKRGLLSASDIVVGDSFLKTIIPEPESPKQPLHISNGAAWFAGLYIAEGSLSNDCIQIAGHALQSERFDQVKEIAESYGGTATVTIEGNSQNIRVYGKLLLACLSELVSGKTAKDKCLATTCWKYGNGFLRSILDGYLSGDGGRDEGNSRWRLGFTRNYNLERDLRVLAARLGFKFSLRPCFVNGFGKKWPAFKGEIRFETSGHHNEKCMEDVVEIRKARCREVYDVGVEDEPHLFALASGLLTHNCKPNPMPESVSGWFWQQHRVKSGKRIPADWKALPKGWDVGEGSHDAVPAGNYRTNGDREATTAEMIDCPGCKKCEPNGGMILRKGNWRCTTSHEYIFQFAKSDSYFCDGEAAKERTTGGAHARGLGVNPKAKMPGKNSRKFQDRDPNHSDKRKQNASFSAAVVSTVSERNKRSVWRIATAPFRGAHFATFPLALVRPIIQIATPAHCCAMCGAPWAPVIERGAARAEQQKACGGDKNGEYHGEATKDFALNGAQDASAVKARILAGMVKKTVKGHMPTCKCKAASAPAVVLDPFAGAFTTCVAAQELGRDSIGIEMNPEYAEMGRARLATTAGLRL